MGYTTDFNGSLELSKPATAAQVNYINTFSATRRMKRNVDELQKLYEGKHGLEGVGYGIDGEYFCFDDGNCGQNKDSSIVNYNSPAVTQPGLWCQWILTDDGKFLEWDGGEKFYSYVEWLKYMISNFFIPWGIELNGEIEWSGEESSDLGKIIVVNNDVVVKEGFIEYR